MLKETKLVNKIIKYARQVYKSLEKAEADIKERENILKLDRQELKEVKDFLERLLK